MSFLAQYPLTVFVANTFAPEEKVVLNVTFRRMLTYYAVGEEPRELTTVTNSKGYNIEGGERIGFPLNFGNEYLEISLKKDENVETPNCDYYIQAGAKTKCIFDSFNGQLFFWEKDGNANKSRIQTFFEIDGVTGTPELDENFYAGGRWKIAAESVDWTMKIKKYNFDPEEDDVVIGPGTPG